MKACQTVLFRQVWLILFYLPEQIPSKILEIAKKIDGNGADENQVMPTDEDLFKQIISLMRVRKGVDFSYYKPSTIQRRILRRMALSKHNNLTDYLNYLRENKNEQDTLYQNLLIPVTSFFRDTKSFDVLCNIILPQLIQNKNPGDPIRIWVTACSTGEEAYSIAICLKEKLDHRQIKVQIFATDINDTAITKARAGIYAKRELEGVNPQRLDEFFTKTDGSYLVNKNIRDMCIFAAS
jgi:two-component system CheB/CheR fusion protein